MQGLFHDYALGDVECRIFIIIYFTSTVQLTCKVNALHVCHAVVPHFTCKNYFCYTHELCRQLHERARERAHAYACVFTLTWVINLSGRSLLTRFDEERAKSNS